MKRINEGLWTHAAPLSLLGAELGTRMTVLDSGQGLVLYSPTPIDDALAEQIESEGEVRWIVAPSLFHHLFAKAAKARWPEARLLAAPGLDAKVRELGSDGELGPEAPDEWGDGIATHPIGGMPKLNEVALLHRPSRTLVVADFLFNVVEAGWWTRTFLGLTGGYGGPRQSRVLRSSVKDREATKRSRDVLLDWDFDTVTMCHGSVIETGGKDALASASAWLE